MLRIVTFKIEEELLEKLDRYARRNGLSRSDAIRKAIERLLEEDEGGVARVEYYRIYNWLPKKQKKNLGDEMEDDSII